MYLLIIDTYYLKKISYFNIILPEKPRFPNKKTQKPRQGAKNPDLGLKTQEWQPWQQLAVINGYEEGKGDCGWR